MIETCILKNQLAIAKIIVPLPLVTRLVQDNKDTSCNAYIVNFKEYKLYGIDDKFDDDTVELLRNNIGPVLADNLIGNIRLSENLKITNTQGTLELDSYQLLLKDFNQHTLAKFNKDGTYFYDSNGIELAKFSTSGARIGNIVITKNSIESGNFIAGSSGFQIRDSGDVEFNDLEVRGTVHATEGDIGGWTIAANQLYATTTGTIKTSLNAGMGYNGVVLDKDGIRVYDDILGCVVNLPSDGSAPTFSSGVITSVSWELDTISVIRTSDTVGDGSASSAGILINNTGIYGCEADQILAEANFKILANGNVYLKGEIQAVSGSIGGFTIAENQLSGGTIIGALMRGSVIENSETLPRIRIDEEGVYYQVTTLIGKYDEIVYGGESGGEPPHYGAGVLGYLFNSNYPPFSIMSDHSMADIRLYNRVDDPGSGTGPHEIGDLICVAGRLKICSLAGSPGTFEEIGAVEGINSNLEQNLNFNQYQAVAMVLENRNSDPVDPEIGQIWIRVD